MSNIRKTCYNCFKRMDCPAVHSIKDNIEYTIENSDKLDKLENLIGELCNKFDIGPKEYNIALFFRSHKRLEFFKSTNTPSEIIKQEKKILKFNLQKLQEFFNIDGMEFLRNEGAIEYMLHCESSNQDEIDMERCHKCDWYGNDTACEKNQDGHLSCDKFSDCGYNINDRVLKFQIDRCQTCMHSTIITKEDIHFELPTCSKKLNMLKPTCSYYIERKKPCVKL